jgi:hypothetical protein
MGDTDYTVNLDTWRLEVAGRVGTPLSLNYFDDFLNNGSSKHGP